MKIAVGCSLSFKLILYYTPFNTEPKYIWVSERTLLPNIL